VLVGELLTRAAKTLSGLAQGHMLARQPPLRNLLRKLDIKKAAQLDKPAVLPFIRQVERLGGHHVEVLQEPLARESYERPTPELDRRDMRWLTRQLKQVSDYAEGSLPRDAPTDQD
jgi:hypothetical protein